MSLLRQIPRGLRQQLRQPETRLFLVALVFAIAALTTVQLGARRTQDLLVARAAEVNGGDLSLASRAALPDGYEQAAREHGLRVARSLAFPTMLFAGDNQQLADIKAVAGDYPVRGSVRVRGGDGPEREAGVPEPGHAYADARLLDALGIAPGDRIEFGDLDLRIAGELLEDPDGAQLFALAPRLLVHLDDAHRAGLLGPGSRASHRLLFAGEAAAVHRYAQWLEPQLERGQTLRRVEEAADALRGAWERGRAFIDLALLLTLALSALAMWLALARFAEREADNAALLRCLGASRRDTLLLPLGQVLLLTLPCLAAGIGVGLAAEAGLAGLAAARFGLDLPPSDPAALLPGVLLLATLLVASVLPPLSGLLRVSPLRTLRAAAATPGRSARWLLLPVLALPAAGLLLGGPPRLVLILVGALAVAGLLCALLVWLALRALARLAPRRRGLARIALVRLARRPLLAILQGSALTLSLTALLLATRTGPELLQQWRDSLPPDTPNWFLVNIQPPQLEPVLADLQAAGAGNLGHLPIATGRLVSVRGIPAADHMPPDPSMQRWRDGPLNLSWSERVPDGNTVVAGEWWPADRDVLAVSVEQRFAQRMGLAPGDRLGLRVGEHEVEVTVANLRETDWDSFRVNFFLVLSPAAAAGVPHAWVASFHLPGDSGAIRQLTRTHPNLSAIDVGAILGRIRDLVGQLTGAARGLLLMALAAALLVLLGALAYAHGERRREAALLRALGIRRGELVRLLALEWLGLGVIAALIAGALSALAGVLLAGQMLRFAYRPSAQLPLLALLSALAVCAVAAWTAARTATRTPPAESLRA